MIVRHPIVDITNRGELELTLKRLRTDTYPFWGKMKAQQMIEHLVRQVRWTNGQWIATCERPADKAEKGKQQMIYSDMEIPKNIFVETLPEEYEYPDIESAKKGLMKEMYIFEQYFKEPGKTSVHGSFGALNYKEWLIWHGKHFSHHFRQFGLIPQSENK